MINRIVNHLKKHGFTDYEAKAYSSVVSIGQGTAREICEISGVPQGRIYTILQTLTKRGFLVIDPGPPAYYLPLDPANLFSSFKEEYSNSIDELISDLKNLHEFTPPSFWTISNEKAIYYRLKLLIQNTKEDLTIFAYDPEALKPYVKDIKTAQKKVNVTILVEDKSLFKGFGLRTTKMSDALQNLFIEMEAKSSRLRDPTWETEIFLISDSMNAINTGFHDSIRVASVYNMPVLFFWIHRLFELLEPAIQKR